MPVSHQTQIRVRRVGEAARHRLVEAVARLVETFDRALAGAERLVVVVDVGRHQIGRFGVGAREQDRRHAHAIGREPRGDQLLDRFARRHQHLAAHVAALLHRGELVLEMHAGGARIDHRLHQLERVQHAAETGFGVGDDRREVIDVALAFHVLDLVGAHERVVDAPHDRRHRVDRIQRLVRIHLAGDVGVGCDLPARQVDRLQARLDLLHRLVAGQRAERIDERLVVDQLPQLFGAAPRQRVLDLQRAAQAHDIFRRVAALDAFPARILRPVLLQSCCFEIVVHAAPIVAVPTPTRRRISRLVRPSAGARLASRRVRQGARHFATCPPRIARAVVGRMGCPCPSRVAAMIVSATLHPNGNKSVTVLQHLMSRCTTIFSQYNQR